MADPKTLTPAQRAYEQKRAAKAGKSLESWLDAKQKRAAAKHIAGSTLDWTILEPGELIDEAGTGTVTLSTEAIEETFVTRADVAAVVVALLPEKAAIGHAYQLTRGKTPIKAAVKKVLK